MKYISKQGEVGSYHVFLFTEHDSRDVNIGDQVWSNGSAVEIAEFCDSDILEDLISMVENQIEFMRALSNEGLINN